MRRREEDRGSRSTYKFKENPRLSQKTKAGDVFIRFKVTGKGTDAEQAREIGKGMGGPSLGARYMQGIGQTKTTAIKRSASYRGAAWGGK